MYQARIYPGDPSQPFRLSIKEELSRSIISSFTPLSLPFQLIHQPLYPLLSGKQDVKFVQQETRAVKRKVGGRWAF